MIDPCTREIFIDQCNLQIFDKLSEPDPEYLEARTKALNDRANLTHLKAQSRLVELVGLMTEYPFRSAFLTSN